MTEPISEWADVERCPVCASADTVEFITNVPPNVERPTTSWKLCQECSHLFCSPRPTDEWLAAYYKKGYRQDTHKSEDPDKVPATSARDEVTRALRIVSTIAAYRGSGPFRRHMDIGSSTGALLATAMDKFSIPSSLGVEPNDAWRQFAADSFEKYQQRKGDDAETRDMSFASQLSDVPLSSRFDLITISHVIEHIPDLADTMQTIKHLLARGGTLYIECPFAFGGIPDPLMFPHLHAFTTHSLQEIIHTSGLFVKRVFLDGTSSPFWPPHQHLVALVSDRAPDYDKNSVMGEYINARDAARKVAEMAKQARPMYELG